MKKIPLNFLTLYADLQQSLGHSLGRGATVATRVVRGTKRLYAVERIGASYKQKYIGRSGEPKAEASAKRLRRIVEEAKVRKATIAALKRARVGAPDAYMGRLLETIAEAGLFEQGAVLVGTAAYQNYPCVVGAYLNFGLLTQDADVAVPLGVTLSGPIDDQVTLEMILKRADPTFEARMNRDEKWPMVFVSGSGFSVDILTPLRRKPGPFALSSLRAAAVPLRYLDYVIEDPIEAVALYGSGVLVTVPQPARYAVHKIIVSGIRSQHSKKAPKDLLQAKVLFEALEDSDTLADAIADARARGPKWRKAVDAGLKKIGRGLDGEPVAAKT
jgi:hypothetical protein